MTKEYVEMKSRVVRASGKVSTGLWFRVEGDMYSVWWACKVIWKTLR